MKNLIILIMFFSTYAYAHEFEFTDKYGKKQYSVNKDGVVKDKNGYNVNYITKDGVVKDKNGYNIGKINVK